MHRMFIQRQDDKFLFMIMGCANISLSLPPSNFHLGGWMRVCVSVGLSENIWIWGWMVYFLGNISMPCFGCKQTKNAAIKFYRCGLTLRLDALWAPIYAWLVFCEIDLNNKMPHFSHVQWNMNKQVRKGQFSRTLNSLIPILPPFNSTQQVSSIIDKFAIYKKKKLNKFTYLCYNDFIQEARPSCRYLISNYIIH